MVDGRRKVVWTPWLLAALAFGCECQDLTFVELSASGQLPGDSLDFGEVPVGARRTLTRTLRNDGTAALEILGVTLEPAEPAFFVEVVPNPVPAQGAAELRASFRPTAELAYESLLQLESNAREALPTLGLRGQGVSPAIEVDPALLDFGNTALGASAQRGLRVRNLRAVDQEIWLSLQDDGAVHFALGDDAGPRRTVPAEGHILVAVDHVPRHGGPHAAQLRVDSCGEGCGVVVELRGRCEVPRLIAEPLRLDFGTLAPGATEQRSVILRNLGFGALNISSAQVATGSADFALVEPFAPASLEPAATLELAVRFAPQRSGESSGRLEIGSDDPATPVGHVELLGQRQGAELLAVPARVEFGVLRDAGPATRHLLLINRGDQPARVLDGAVTGDAFASTLLPLWPVEIAGGSSAVLEVSFAPTGVGTFYGRLELRTDVGETPQLVVALAGTRSEQGCVLVPAVEVLRFGSVLVGSSSWQNLVLRNQGNAACPIASVQFSPLHINDPAFTLVGSTSALLEPGQQTQVRVLFAPTLGGQAKAALRVQMADPSLPALLVGLQGSGARAGISAAPPVLDFGTTAASCGSREGVVAIGNIGQVAVSLGAARLESPGSDAFTIVAGGWIGMLSPGWRHLIRVRFEPLEAGLHSAALVVDGDAEMEGVVVPLSGLALATPDAQVGEHFEVPPLHQVDVLFIVDNSGSMSDNQANLATNFDHFIRYADFVGMAIDYQLAVITTDVDDPNQAGRIISTPRLLRRSTSNLAERFSESVRVGTQGSGWEQGLHASFLALSPPLIDDPIYNKDFLRPGAALAVCIVSDEDDGSPQPVEAYVGFLQGLKLAQRLPAQFHAVTGGELGCLEGDVWASPAPRYDEAVRSTGGSWADLCAPDWGSQLEDLGAAVFLSRGRFQLQGTPDPSTLAVYVDGVLLDPELWSYDPASRAVTLDPSALPPVGSSVDIDYVISC